MRKSLKVMAVSAATCLLLAPAVVNAEEFGPVLGLGTDSGGGVLVADAARGVARPDGTLVAELPNISDVAASDQGWWWATTGGGPELGDGMLYKVWPNGTVKPFASLVAYEVKKNPHPAEVDSNPFSVADLGGGAAVVADAGGNSLLSVNKHGKVKLIATFPDELVSTANAKSLVEEALSNLFETSVSCDALPGEAPPEAVELCSLPPMIPAESVPTSVAIGSDGAFYVGELKGFPAPVDESRVWRIEKNARNARCGQSPLCSVAHDGFTAVVDLAFGSDGTLYVAELDEKSWFAFELAFFEGLPIEPGLGTINACSGGCVEAVPDVPFLTAITVDGAGTLWWGNFIGVVAPAP